MSLCKWIPLATIGLGFLLSLGIDWIDVREQNSKKTANSETLVGETEQEIAEHAKG